MKFSLLLTPIVIATLSGCAALGSKSNFNASVPITGITDVALTTSSVSLPTGVSAQQADSVFVKELATKLATATGWRVTYIGEAEAVLKNANEFFQNSRYQAIVHAELMLKSYGTLRGTPRYNAWTRLQIFKIPEKQLIGESHFNTLIGKSYALHPELTLAIQDGTTGLVAPWQKRTHPTQ
ncbi:hypothetical protein [Hymenobacter yonginensis]|uniref:Lipoprotein n=1 Tax=Hymenobacter yonginensis TaxID=748197 RepID=A0ABY7PM16_9BACT|nr:hypothetical protein [Hymenobacter yonginensis]WBO83055.1 hypothetical protein O9Z63_11760 [Hymenobacter yonginensis]